MSTTRTVSLVLMLAGFVVCYFLFGIGIVVWLLLAFLISFGLIFVGLVTKGSLSPIFLIVTWVLGIALFWFLFGWKVALVYFLLYCVFTMVQPNAK